MYRLKPFQSFFTILYVLGLNPFISFHNINKRPSKVISFFLRFINVVESLLVIYLTNIAWRHAKWFAIFVHLSFTFDVCINLIAVFENLSNFNATYRILQTVSIVIELFVTTFAANFPYNTIKKSIKWKFLIIMSTVFLKFLGHRGTNPKKLIINILWTIFNTISNFHLLHLIFYIEFMKCILLGLSEKIVKLTNHTRVYWRHEKTKEWMNMIHRIKLIHFKLWRIARAVNSLFGWFLFSFMMEQATNFIFYAYYIFVTANLNPHFSDGTIWIFRKYSIIIIFDVIDMHAPYCNFVAKCVFNP